MVFLSVSIPVKLFACLSGCKTQLSVTKFNGGVGTMKSRVCGRYKFGAFKSIYVRICLIVLNECLFSKYTGFKCGPKNQMIRLVLKYESSLQMY